MLPEKPGRYASERVLCGEQVQATSMVLGAIQSPELGWARRWGEEIAYLQEGDLGHQGMVCETLEQARRQTRSQDSQQAAFPRIQQGQTLCLKAFTPRVRVEMMASQKVKIQLTPNPASIITRLTYQKKSSTTLRTLRCELPLLQPTTRLYQ